MNLPVEKKLEFLSEILETFADKFSIVNMQKHASEAAKQNLKIRRADLQADGAKMAEPSALAGG